MSKPNKKEMLEWLREECVSISLGDATLRDTEIFQTIRLLIEKFFEWQGRVEKLQCWKHPTIENIYKTVDIAKEIRDFGKEKK